MGKSGAFNRETLSGRPAMRIPRNPPDERELLDRFRDEFVEAVRDARYAEFARDANARYWHWDRVRIIARERGLEPELAWLVVALGRGAWRTLPLSGAGGRPLRYTMPDAIQREAMLIDQQRAGQIGLDDTGVLTSGQRDRFVVTMLMEEAISSSMLEGAVTTRREAKQMLREDRRPKTHGERMVANNYRAMQFVRDHVDRPMTPELLLEIQGVLVDDTVPADQVARFRTSNDRVHVVDQYEEVVHEPPLASELPQRLEELCAFANQRGDSEAFIHPVVRASVLHFQLGLDHPFCDGNGRTARALFFWSMLRSGYWLIEFLPISPFIRRGPAKYGRAFLEVETDDFDVTYFLVYTARILRRAREELIEHVRDKQREILRAGEHFSSEPDLNHRQRALLMHAVRHPDSIYSIEGHRNSHRVAYATARKDLMDLVAAGLLTQLRVGKRLMYRLADRRGHAVDV